MLPEQVVKLLFTIEGVYIAVHSQAKAAVQVHEDEAFIHVGKVLQLIFAELALHSMLATVARVRQQFKPRVRQVVMGPNGELFAGGAGTFVYVLHLRTRVPVRKFDDRLC